MSIAEAVKSQQRIVERARKSGYTLGRYHGYLIGLATGVILTTISFMIGN